MYREDVTYYSNCLNRDMHIKVYGHDGAPFIVFPCQDAMADNFENFGMIDLLSNELEKGKIRLFCVDTVDTESWSDEFGNKEHRAYIQEQYYYHITDEVVPYIQEYHHVNTRPFTIGFSLGATHAAILFFRRPDLFEGCLSLSGCYDTREFWGNWMNETLYNNSPVDFLGGMSPDHPYVALYNQRKPILCVGQGRWEEVGIKTSRQIKEISDAKGMGIWVDFWGYDVDHDWPWWKVQIKYFLPFLLNEVEYR